MFKGHRIIVIGDAHDSPHISQDRFKWSAIQESGVPSDERIAWSPTNIFIS